MGREGVECGDGGSDGSCESADKEGVRWTQLEAETAWEIPNMKNTAIGRDRYMLWRTLYAPNGISLAEFKKLKRPIKITGV